MWGNALGWCISLAMVVGTAIGLVWLNDAVSTVSPRTRISLDGKLAGAIELPVPPVAVVPSISRNTDAADVYRKALEQYQQNPLAYEKFARSGLLGDLEDVAAIWTLVQASECIEARLFETDPAQIVNYHSERPPLDGLRTLGACARRAGQLLQREGRTEQAMQLYEAAFSLGEKLYRERLTWAQLDAGLTMMAEAATLIGELSAARGDTVRALACRQFNDARKTYVAEQLLPLQRILSSLDQTVIDRHAGDVFYFARHCPERMWRVEAILKLGRYRFNAERVGDQRGATKLLKQLSQDADPVIRAAADAALKLTAQEYRWLR
jgi:tetratricopeptide (TPR) repeat protein